jgi:hypothetical protein
MDINRGGGLSASVRAWKVNMLAICIAVAVNLTAFMLFGIAAGIQTFFPLVVDQTR